jgi:hypothetical protein
MECDYTCLNHNSLMLPQKRRSDHQGCDYKGGFIVLDSTRACSLECNCPPYALDSINMVFPNSQVEPADDHLS